MRDKDKLCRSSEQEESYPASLKGFLQVFGMLNHILVSSLMICSFILKVCLTIMGLV